MSCCSKKPKVFETKNGKVLHEFNCSNCSGYITVKLDEDLQGAHCVVCPSCSHEHYRIIKDGVITEDRAPSSAKSFAIRICPTKAAYSKTSWETKMAERKTKLDDGGKHMLGDLWKRVVDKQKQTPPVAKEEERDYAKEKEKLGCMPADPYKPEPCKGSPVVTKDYTFELSIMDAMLDVCDTLMKDASAKENFEYAVVIRNYKKELKAKKETMK